jgi:TetR/AcrR family transcriptional regulator, transcriptional repressor of bet genes
MPGTSEITEAPSQSSRSLHKSVTTRRRLIEATIVAIAAGGLHEATLTVVSDISGLSRGLVGYHFKTKNQMLRETLMYLTSEYREGWQAALSDPDASAEMRLLQLIDFDLGRKICSVHRVAVWYAFWGSVVTKRLYREVSLPADRNYIALISQQVKALAREDRIQGLEPGNIAKGYAALVIGLWQQFNVSPGDFDRGDAKAICRAHFHGFFPTRFQRPSPRNRRKRNGSPGQARR